MSASTLAGAGTLVRSRPDAGARLDGAPSGMGATPAAVSPPRRAGPRRGDESFDAFAHAFAHNLRSPLGAMELFVASVLQTARDRLEPLEIQRLELARRMVHQSDRSLADYLDLVRCVSTEPRTVTVDVSTLVEEESEELRRRHPERTVETLIEPGVTVDADERLLRIALAALLDNAWKYTARTARPRVEFGRVSRTSVLFVSDNGAGFAPERTAELFEPFSRLHSDDQFEGSGLGLALVRQVIDRHDGSVWAESRPDAGATFFFTLSPRGRTRRGDGDDASPSGDA